MIWRPLPLPWAFGWELVGGDDKLTVELLVYFVECSSMWVHLGSSLWLDRDCGFRGVGGSIQSGTSWGGQFQGSLNGAIQRPEPGAGGRGRGLGPLFQRLFPQSFF